MGRTAPWRRVAFDALAEARRPIEMELAQLAAVRATSADLAAMEAAVDEYARALGQGERGRMLFLHHLCHYTIARAAHSEVLLYYQHRLLEQLAIALRRSYRRREVPDHAVHLHREAFEAIKSRDPARVREAMDRHFTGLEVSVRAKSSARQPTAASR
jgi:DNA-binding GntR family transcriptional regulator